jgi:Uma2 family endonuclease
MVQLPNLSLFQGHPQRPLNPTLPTMYDLPSEDPEEPGLPDEFHDLQPQLLSRTLQLRHYTQDQCFTASDLNLYYDAEHLRWYKRPDWFLVVGVPRLYEGRDLRRSYVVWQEGQVPQVVVEFLSPGTEQEDLGRFYDPSAQIPEPEGAIAPPLETAVVPSETPSGQRIRPPQKFELYERQLQVPHYLVYSRYTRQLRYFKLIAGAYQECELKVEPPLIWLEDLEIGLGIWQGEFSGITSDWLRWCDLDGTWLLTDTEQERVSREAAEQQAVTERQGREREQQAREREQQAREREQQAREQAEAQLQQAARNLLATGMPPTQVAQILGLSLAQVQDIASPDEN